MIRKATGYAYYSDYESENYKPKWEAEIQGEWLNYSLSKKYKDFKIEYKIFEKNSSDCLMTETITIYDKVLEPYEKEIIGLRLKGLDNLNKNLQYRIEWRMISCISE
jgi:hypothetical protein